MTAAQDKTPSEQLVELLVYAPVGLLYEYENVRETLVKRGRSQVELAKIMGKMAAQRGQAELGDDVGDVLGVAAVTLARGITELGAAIGLAPPRETAPPREPFESGAAGPTPTSDVPDPGGPAVTPRPLPIAGYDDLKAKEIVALVADLDADQRQRIREHETSHRGRKTVLARLDRLER